MTNPSRHTEWLSLVEVSGPFLAVPVLEKAFPQGLDVVETPKRQRLRAAYEEWCDAVEDDDPLLHDLHREWIRLVFKEILEYDGSTLTTDAEKAKTYMVASPERTETFAPDWLVVSPSDGKPHLFVSVQRPGTDLEKVQKDDRWPASLLERMAALCRSHAVRLGVVTDGERWTLVNAPVGGTSSHASWYARLWFQEPVTLKAFQSLWSVRRCFGPSDETLEALLDSSLEHHEEITDTLGEQVRRAVEVLVQCLDKADADRNGELLRDVSPAELYEAGLTVMMRLVFVLCAEERGLLLSGDPVYDECYAVSTLRAQLAEEADRHGPEILERRHDAWARLLAVFRAVHGGIDHESLRLPALGGSLFDPDRFSFLEGRSKGTSWRESDAAPLPIDNRTVLLLLGSLQLREQHGGALLLSYRALDVEQIGHVYEGLLEHTVARIPSVTIGLTGSKKAKNPNLPLSELESARMDGEDTLVALVKETTECSESAIRNALARPVDETVFGRLLAVCGGDMTLAERIRPFANLVRTDAWGDPIVYREGAFMVTLGADRRETGTHYTPKSLTESIVETTLEPVAYIGPAEGKPREEWKLKTPAELLELKICDPAMGSGAFLVQACRWLAERLVEAWAAEEAAGKFVTADGEVLDRAGEADPMPKDPDERLLAARRLVAERCLFGVDVNPLAVELAKLSIWLVTLAKGRPFGFLDHNLRCGDSLLGIHRLDQLTKLKLNPDDGPYQQRIFGQNVAGAVAEAVEIRKRLRAVPIRDIRDVETMARLDAEARKRLESVELVADAMIGEVLRANGNARAIDSALDSLAMQVGQYLNGDETIGVDIERRAKDALSLDLPPDKPPRKPFHWPLEFPEVFVDRKGGFDAIVTNPPFAEGEVFADSMRSYFKSCYAVQAEDKAIGKPRTSKINLVTLFVERFLSLCRFGSSIGFVVPKPFLRNERYWRGRMVMLQRALLYKIFNLPSNFFRSASVETCAIVVRSNLCKSSTVGSYDVIDIASPHVVIPARLDYSAILSDKHFTIRIESSPPILDLITRLAAENGVLSDYYETRDGINPGRRDFRPIFLGHKEGNRFIPNAFPGQGRLLPHPLAEPEVFDTEIHKPTINGRDFAAYTAVTWDGTYLRYTKDLAYVEDFYVKGTRWSAQLRDRENYDRDEKVLSRQTADTLIATLDCNRYFPLNTVHIHFPKDPNSLYSCKVLLALLNSNLLRFFYRAKSEETGKVFPQVHISAIRLLPCPRKIDHYVAVRITELVERIMRKGVSTELLLEIDNVVYDLYGILEEEREMIRQSQTAIDGGDKR